jgi:hypothetical protein
MATIVLDESGGDLLLSPPDKSLFLYSLLISLAVCIEAMPLSIAPNAEEMSAIILGTHQ